MAKLFFFVKHSSRERSFSQKNHRYFIYTYHTHKTIIENLLNSNTGQNADKQTTNTRFEIDLKIDQKSPT